MPHSDAPRPTTRFVEPDPDRMSAAQRAVWDRLAGGPRGKVPTPYRIWMSSPQVAAHFEALGLHLLREGALTPCEAEIAILVSATHNRSAFVQTAHVAVARRHGLPDNVVRNIMAGAAPALDDRREQAIFALTRKLVTHQPVDDMLFNDARILIGDAGLAELTALLGYYAAVEMIVSLYAIPCPKMD